LLNVRELSLTQAGTSGETRQVGSELLDRLRRGDVAAFEELYRQESDRMKSLAHHLLGSAQDAEDAVQEAFLKIYRGAARFRGASAVTTWTYRVLVNTCYDLLRRRRRSRESAALDAAGDAATVSRDHPLRLALESSLAKLTPRQREVFLLFEVEGFSHREVGEILEMPEATSRSVLYAAKRELQARLWPGHGPARPVSA
jgi:RNA polymerase sigma-70 factor (ECF subfamily)